MGADYGITPERIRRRNILPALVFVALFALHGWLSARLSLLLDTEGGMVVTSVVASAVMALTLAALARGRRFEVRPILLTALWAALTGFAVWVIFAAFFNGGKMDAGQALSAVPWLAMLRVVTTFDPASSFLLCAAAAALALRLGWGRPTAGLG